MRQSSLMIRACRSRELNSSRDRRCLPASVPAGLPFRQLTPLQAIASGFLLLLFLVPSSIIAQDSLEYYLNLGEANFDQRDFDSAIHYFHLAAQTPVEDSSRQRYTYQMLGNSLYYKGKMTHAFDAYQKALHLALIEGDSARIGDCYYNVGFILQQRGDYTLSIDYLFKAHSYYQDVYGAESVEVGEAYNMIGVAYHYQEKHDKSVEYHHKALAIRLKAFGLEHSKTAGSYNNLGMSYDRMKRYEEAIEHLQKATEIRIKTLGPTHAKVGGGHTNLGACYNSMGQFENGLRQHQEALRIYLLSLHPKHPKVVASYGNIGISYSYLKNPAKQLEYCHRSLVAASADFANPDPYQNPPASELLINPNTTLSITYKAIAFWELYKLHGKVEDLHKAYETYDLGLQFLLRIRELPLAKQSQQWWQTRGKKLYRGGIEVALELFEVEGDSIWLHQGYRIAETEKASLLYRELLHAQAKVFANLPPEVLAEEARLKAKVGELEKELFLLKKEFPDTSRIDKLQGDLFGPRDSLTTLIQQLKQEYPLYHQWQYQFSTPQIQALQAALPDSGSLVVEYVFGSEQLHAFAIGPHSVSVYSFPKDSLRKRIVEMRTLLKQPDQLLTDGQYQVQLARIQELGSSLYRDLLAPVLQDHHYVEHLVILPDQYLGYLPFSLLVREPGKYQDYKSLDFLLKKYAIRYEYSSAVFLHSLKHRPNSSGSWVGFAPATDTSQKEWKPLFHNQSEVRKIRQITHGKAFLGEQATETAVKSVLGRSRFLHLASHAYTDDKQPAFSAMIFSKEENEREDGLLYAYEIYQSQIKAEVAFLSGCNTGFGPIEDGEGVMSLARAFKSAGCANVVMSLWPVDDAATAQLMEKVYAYLKSGLPKDQAIQQAKLDMILASPQAHPHYWASFVLIGDDLAVDFSESSPFPIWLWGLVALVLLFVLYRLLARNRQSIAC